MSTTCEPARLRRSSVSHSRAGSLWVSLGKVLQIYKYIILLICPSSSQCWVCLHPNSLPIWGHSCRTTRSSMRMYTSSRRSPMRRVGILDIYYILLLYIQYRKADQFSIHSQPRAVCFWSHRSWRARDQLTQLAMRIWVSRLKRKQKREKKELKRRCCLTRIHFKIGNAIKHAK